MTASATGQRTSAANQARQEKTRRKLQRIEETLTRMRRQHTPVTYPAVASRAGVSRTFLYENADAKALMATTITTADTHRHQARIEQDAQAEASWRERALNAEDALKAAHEEIRTQRERIALLLGQIRELEGEHPEETRQRITTENTTLRQRVRQHTQDTRALEEKLQAARANNRFLDKRIADLEAQLAQQPGLQP